MAKRNNWDVRYPAIRFMESALNNHTQVASFAREKDIQFRIVRERDMMEVIAVLIDRYTISLADLLAVRSEFPEATYIVASGAWCGYTHDAKEFGIENGIGVFNVTEFFAALWRTDPIKYADKDKDGNPVYAYKAA